MASNYKNYTKTRFVFDRNRKAVWKEIAGYLGRWTRAGTVVELGSGYCDFINSVRAEKKIAVDKHINPKEYCSKEVTPIFGGYEKIAKILPDGSVDMFLMSNFLEHLEFEEASKCLELVYRKLKKSGRVIIIQPNYRHSSKNYFDDYTHRVAWSDTGLKEFLKAKKFRIIRIEPKFMPFSMKSKLPKNKLLVRMYLRLPIRLFAGQMLIIGEKI